MKKNQKPCPTNCTTSIKKSQKIGEKFRESGNSCLQRKEKKTDLIYQIYTTVTHHFPQLFDWMREVDDPRKKASPLELAAHLTACLAMFIFKAGSRNEYSRNGLKTLNMRRMTNKTVNARLSRAWQPN